MCAKTREASKVRAAHPSYKISGVPRDAGNISGLRSILDRGGRLLIRMDKILQNVTNYRYPEHHGPGHVSALRPRRSRGHMALAPFLRGDYEKESTTARSTAASSCGVFRRRLRPCRTERKPIGTFTNGNNLDGGVSDAGRVTAGYHRTIPAHGRLHIAQCDRRPGETHLHGGPGRVLDVQGHTGQQVGQSQDVLGGGRGDRRRCRPGPRPHHGNRPARKVCGRVSRELCENRGPTRHV